MHLFKHLIVICFLCSWISAKLVDIESEEDPFLDEDDASQFIQQNQNVDKRFLYTGKEQRREAKEAYEEKCERKFNSIRNKPRWCPELETWPAWNQKRAGDGAIYNQFNNKPGSSNQRPNQFPNGNNGPYPNNQYPNQYPGANRPNNQYPNNNNNNNFNKAPYNPNKPFDPNQFPFNQNGGNNIQFNNQKPRPNTNNDYPYKQ